MLELKGHHALAAVTAALALRLEALCLSSCQSSSLHPHRRSNGHRRPHSCTASTFSRFPFARRQRFRRCPDIVCGTLTGQGLHGESMLPDHAERAAHEQAQRGPGEVRREAHPSIQMPPHRSTVAPSLQPSPSASSTVRHAASSHQQAFLLSLSRNAAGSLWQASTRATQLALMLSAPSHVVIRSKGACRSRLLHPCRRMHPPDEAI